MYIHTVHGSLREVKISPCRPVVANTVCPDNLQQKFDIVLRDGSGKVYLVTLPFNQIICSFRFYQFSSLYPDVYNTSPQWLPGLIFTLYYTFVNFVNTIIMQKMSLTIFLRIGLASAESLTYQNFCLSGPLALCNKEAKKNIILF